MAPFTRWCYGPTLLPGEVSECFIEGLSLGLQLSKQRLRAFLCGVMCMLREDRRSLSLAMEHIRYKEAPRASLSTTVQLTCS